MVHLWWPYTSTFLAFLFMSQIDLYSMSTQDALAGYKACEPQFFHCGAVELAKKLLGQYLYCGESQILVRIVETEAYPSGDERVYKGIFGAFIPIQAEGGVLVQLSAALHDKKPHLHKGGGLHVYVAARGLAEPIRSCDMVLIRSCEPCDAQGDLWVNPTSESKGMEKEWTSNTILYEEGGVQLYHKTDAPPVSTESTMRGKRILSRKKFEDDGSGSVNNKYRFVLVDSQKGLPGDLQNKNSLEKMD